MNSEAVEKFRYLLTRFKERDYDAALDGLVKACDALNGVESQEAFIYEVMKNQVLDGRRKDRAVKRELDMNKKPSSIEQREYSVSLPTSNGRRVTKKKGNFEQFYANWLGEHGLADSIHIRRTAELDWDKCRVINPSAIIVSLSDEVFIGSPDGVDERTIQEFIPSDTLTPEELAELNEHREQLAGLSFVKNEGLKKLLASFVEPGVPSSESKLKAAYIQAILWIIANHHNDDPRFNVPDLCKLCEMCGIKFVNIHRMEPADAEKKLLKFEIDKTIYKPRSVTF
jgi:hypothetical protein